MNIEELENKHGDIPLETLNFDEFYYSKHTKLSIEFAISVLESDELLGVRCSASGEDIYYKIQELKEYLDEI